MVTSDTAALRSRIFISYRREDAEYPVGRLAEDLRKHFARDQVHFLSRLFAARPWLQVNLKKLSLAHIANSLVPQSV